ncbi:hypothetical protein [Pseudodonghicola sp.]|uniref:hypothetical protein n=1 Tax=Pseudodonghicola sp. TaxID=1969463 RepID=UPI003A985B33
MNRETLPPGHPLGSRRQKFEELAQQRGIARGFMADGSDPAAAEKEAMEQALYRHADAHMESFASALGASGGAGSEDEEGR